VRVKQGYPRQPACGFKRKRSADWYSLWFFTRKEIRPDCFALI